MAEASKSKHHEATAPFCMESIRQFGDVELFSLWEQSHYGQRGELSYQEWLRRTGYPDLLSARNAYSRYQDIARHLRIICGLPCAKLTELAIHKRRRRQELHHGRTAK